MAVCGSNERFNSEPRDSPNEPHARPPGGFPSAFNTGFPIEPSYRNDSPSSHANLRCEGYVPKGHSLLLKATTFVHSFTIVGATTVVRAKLKPLCCSVVVVLRRVGFIPSLRSQSIVYAPPRAPRSHTREPPVRAHAHAMMSAPRPPPVLHDAGSPVHRSRSRSPRRRSRTPQKVPDLGLPEYVMKSLEPYVPPPSRPSSSHTNTPVQGLRCRIIEWKSRSRETALFQN